MVEVGRPPSSNYSAPPGDNKRLAGKAKKVRTSSERNVPPIYPIMPLGGAALHSVTPGAEMLPHLCS